MKAHPPASHERPQATRAPRPAASAATCSASRDLPMPGSPVNSSTRPLPAQACSSPRRARPSKSARVLFPRLDRLEAMFLLAVRHEGSRDGVSAVRVYQRSTFEALDPHVLLLV